MKLFYPNICNYEKKSTPASDTESVVGFFLAINHGAHLSFRDITIVNFSASNSVNFHINLIT